MDPWIIADSHFGFTGQGEGIERPVGFSEKILKGLERVLNSNSVLIHLGDVCYIDDRIWNEKLTGLPGKKWLIIGNHDKNSASWYLDHGWDFAGHSMSLEAFGKNILFSHTPMITNIAYLGLKGYIDYRYDINIHGHFHNFTVEKVKEKEPEIFKILNKKHFLVSMEKLNYQPIKLKRIVELINMGKYCGLENALNP